MSLFPDNLANDTLPPATCNPSSRGLSSLACDRYHHYYHYQSSAQYLWLARTWRVLGQEEAAQAAYAKALFQDHFNEAAGKERVATRESRLTQGSYDKHPLLDSVFCASIGAQAGDATALHDEAVTAFLRGDNEQAFVLLDKAISREPSHSNSYFARGRCWFTLGEYHKAQTDLEEAIRLSHRQHDAYHRFASEKHLARGQKFLAAGETDLAIAGFSKALDLYPRNVRALLARATAYRQKGNVELATRDEREAHSPRA